MTYKGVFWYGVVITALSLMLGWRDGGTVIDAALFAAINWVLFVLPVIFIRNALVRRKERRATA